MGRPATKTTEPANMPALLPQAEQAVVQMQEGLAQQSAQAMALAQELGYQGQLSVGALEDEIRFYQRRSVEALLECGKRLLLLKKMTAHGEFEQRVEMLGFSYRTASRFMQAAQKTSKSANLALLSAEVKSASAFLELVTHDDDVLENLAEMDNIDRMSASELRAALRQSEQDVKFANEKRGNAEERADKAEKKLAGNRPVVVPLDQRIADFKAEIGERQNLIEKAVAAHMEASAALDAWWTSEVTNAPDYDPSRPVAMPRPVALVALQLEDDSNRLARLVGALQHDLQNRFGADLAEARQYLMQEPESADA